MRAKEFLREATTEKPVLKKLGRAFNHLEDLVFFYGSAGTMEALEHLKNILSKEGAESLRMKWDGNPQIYWGRERKGGPLILAGHNGWSRGAKTDNPKDLEDFIANKSGNPKTPEEQRARQMFAKQFANLYSLFDKATPKDFQGFVYGDGLFLNTPSLENGIYSFCPNPKSKTCYHVRADSPLGQSIANAKVMVVGHAYFQEFGMDDEMQRPMDDFSMFNRTPQLIVQGPVYNSNPISLETTAIDEVENYLQKHSSQIDGFLQETPGLGDLKNILYTYVNQTAKGHQLDNLGAKHFFNWLQNSKVSVPKQTKIQEKATANQNALTAIFTLVSKIMNLKDKVIDQVEQGRGEIWDTEGEGRVRYADQDKKFGNVKFVPRRRWTPT